MVKPGILILVLTGVAFGATVGAKAQRTVRLPADGNGIVQFSLPSGDIGCTYIPFDGAGGIETGTGTLPELHCYRTTGRFEAASLGPSGPARELRLTGKLDCCGANILAYGSTWQTGGYNCTAAQGTLTCTRGIHGFIITSNVLKRF
jgi:hypothetical protein